MSSKEYRLNSASAGEGSPNEKTSSQSRKRRRPRKVEREGRPLLSSSPFSSSSSPSRSSPPVLGPSSSGLSLPSGLCADLNVLLPPIRRSARVSTARRVHALDQGQEDPYGDYDKDRDDTDESGADVKAVKKGDQIQTDTKLNTTVPSFASRREKKRSRTLKEIPPTSTNTTAAGPERKRVRGRTEASSTLLSQPSTMERGTGVSKKRSSSESRTRTQPPSSFKRAKNAARGEGTMEKSLAAREKSSRWTPEEDAALFEGVSVYLKSKGLQVHPPSHLPTGRDIQLLQPMMTATTTAVVDCSLSKTEEVHLGRPKQPLYRSISTSSSSSLNSSSSSFPLSPPATLVAPAVYPASGDSLDIGRSSGSLWAMNNSASSSSSPSPHSSSSSSIYTGSTLTSEINHTLSLVRLENSPCEDDLESEEIKVDKTSCIEDEENVAELFNRYVDSSSSSPPWLQSAQIGQESFSLPEIHLPSGFVSHQEPFSALQFLPLHAQPQNSHGYSMVNSIQVNVRSVDWAWASQVSSFYNNADLAIPFVGSGGSAAGMVAPLAPYSETQFSVSTSRLNYQVSNKAPHEHLWPMTPDEILAAENNFHTPSRSSSSSSSCHLSSQHQRAIDEADMDMEKGHDRRDTTQSIKKSREDDHENTSESDHAHDRFQTQDSHALVVSRALSHCPWSSVVQASPRLAGIRTGVQAQARWSEALDPQVLKGPWTEAEDQMLMQRVEQFAKCWIWIADGIPGRTQRQCRTRWVQIQTRLERERAVSTVSPATSKTGKKVRRIRK